MSKWQYPCQTFKKPRNAMLKRAYNTPLQPLLKVYSLPMRLQIHTGLDIIKMVAATCFFLFFFLKTHFKEH